jgi:hypothetical protein
VIARDLTRLGPPLSKYQILVRELRAIEYQIRTGKPGAVALARKKEKLRRRLEAERSHTSQGTAHG